MREFEVNPKTIGPPIQRPLCDLVTKHAFSVMVANMPELASSMEEVKSLSERHDYYPDGTLLIEYRHDSSRVWDLIIRNKLLGSGHLDSSGIWYPLGFCGLGAFSGKAYYLWYTSDYREGLGEQAFGMAFPGMISHPTEEYDLSTLLISVGFKKKPTPDIRNRFATCIGDCLRSVSNQGLFGEGPIKAVSQYLEFRGRLAQFRIDASRSGQDTLNWFLISALNFGYIVSPVGQFLFNQEKNIELFVGRISTTEVQRVLITPSQASPSGSPIEENRNR